MTEKGYKIVGDNLGEYSILRADDTIVSTEIQDVIFAESVLDELNALHEENEALKLDNKLLLEEIKEIRDKLTVYLQIKGIK